MDKLKDLWNNHPLVKPLVYGFLAVVLFGTVYSLLS